MSIKFVYSIEISVGAFSYFRPANKGSLARCTVMIDTSTSRATTYTTNISESFSRTTSMNLYLSISSTHLVFSMTFARVYFLSVSFLTSNLMFTLLNTRKNIARTTSILVSASKKVLSRN